MKYTVKRIENFEGDVTTGFLNVNGFFNTLNPLRLFDSEEDALDYIDTEESDPKYDKKYMGSCTFEVVPVSNLKRLREASGMSRTKLAELSGVGVRSIEGYEQGLRDINKAQGLTLQALAQVLNCNIEDLLEL